MEDPSYEKIREEALEAEPEKGEEAPEEAPAEKPRKTGAKKKEKDPGAPKEKAPRMICEGCGRSYSIHTKRHNCKAPKGFEKKEATQGVALQNIPPQTIPPPLPPEVPLAGPAERQITLADVTQFLFAESKARRGKRRDDLLAKMS